MILFINACVRKQSRTKRLADHLLSCLGEDFEELRLDSLDFPKTDEAFLEKREKLIAEKQFDHEIFDLARQFARADKIVIAAPLWDLSFPAALKQYFEQINVVGIQFRYTEKGVPQKLCRAESLYYVTTSGGPYIPTECGFGYVKALSAAFYGIEDVEYFEAKGLDILGADTEQILLDCERKITEALKKTK
jgi:FMN-dependent NADH-azoreductase